MTIFIPMAPVVCKYGPVRGLSKHGHFLIAQKLLGSSPALQHQVQHTTLDSFTTTTTVDLGVCLS